MTALSERAREQVSAMEQMKANVVHFFSDKEAIIADLVPERESIDDAFDLEFDEEAGITKVATARYNRMLIVLLNSLNSTSTAAHDDQEGLNHWRREFTTIAEAGKNPETNQYDFPQLFLDNAAGLISGLSIDQFENFIGSCLYRENNIEANAQFDKKNNILELKVYSAHGARGGEAAKWDTDTLLQLANGVAIRLNMEEHEYISLQQSGLRSGKRLNFESIRGGLLYSNEPINIGTIYKDTTISLGELADKANDERQQCRIGNVYGCLSIHGNIEAHIDRVSGANAQLDLAQAVARVGEVTDGASVATEYNIGTNGGLFIKRASDIKNILARYEGFIDIGELLAAQGLYTGTSSLIRIGTVSNSRNVIDSPNHPIGQPIRINVGRNSAVIIGHAKNKPIFGIELGNKNKKGAYITTEPSSTISDLVIARPEEERNISITGAVFNDDGMTTYTIVNPPDLDMPICHYDSAALFEGQNGSLPVAMTDQGDNIMIKQIADDHFVVLEAESARAISSAASLLQAAATAQTVRTVSRGTPFAYLST